MILLIEPTAMIRLEIDRFCRHNQIENPEVTEIESRGGCRTFAVRCLPPASAAPSAHEIETAPQGQA